MKKDSQEYILALIVEEMQNEIIVLITHLKKAQKMTLPARRARLSTIRLQKMFKNFRKVSCEVGLK